ncbi:MAG: ABC transporter permease, partial [Methanoregula sp.]|nr:ABC transporter permease [Methanoregula sp.]
LGFLNKFLALPTPREDILFGKILFITIRGVIQSTIILFVAILIGATILSPTQYGMIYLILILFGIVLSGLATTLALYLGDHDSYAAVNTMITMPLFFTSSALMPYDVMPPWLRVIASVNPLSFAIDAIRSAGTGEVPLVQIVLLAVLGIAVIAICMQVFRKMTV